MTSTHDKKVKEYLEFIVDANGLRDHLSRRSLDTFINDFIDVMNENCQKNLTLKTRKIVAKMNVTSMLYAIYECKKER